MKILFTVSLLALFLVGCGGTKKENKNITYHNIVILSDLSSRISNKPAKDDVEIVKLVDYFKNECVKPGEKIGDNSSITFSSFSDASIASIDLSKIKNLSEKQKFINSTGKYENNGFNEELVSFHEKVKHAYSTINNQGLDLISVLMDKINNGNIIKNNSQRVTGKDTTFINFENDIYVFTDGYLEYVNKKENHQYYFGDPEIKKIRQYCIDNKVDVEEALARNSELGLPASKNEVNKIINLHVLETHERDKNDKLQTYKYQQGHRDNEILAAVWTKWAKDSGFKNFKWKKY